MRRTFVHALVAALLATSCSAPSPFEGEDYRNIKRKTPLPFSVVVRDIQFELGGGSAPAGRSEATGAAAGNASGSWDASADVRVPKIAQESTEDAIIHASVEALDKYDVFSLARGASLPGSLSPDLEITFETKAPESRSVGSTSFTSNIWWNLGLWLFCGVPSWFLPDVQIDQKFTITYFVKCIWGIPAQASSGDEKDKWAVEREELEEIAQRSVQLADVNTLNFVRRAAFWQYLAEVLVPPFLLPPDREIADASLCENYLSRIQSDLAGNIKLSLLRWVFNRRMPILVPIVPENGWELAPPAEFLAAVYTQGEITDVRVTVASTEGSARGGPVDAVLRDPPTKQQEDQKEAACTRDFEADRQFLEGYSNQSLWFADLSGLHIERGDFLVIEVLYYDGLRNKRLKWKNTIRLAPGPDQ